VKPKILVADDEPDMRRVVSRELAASFVIVEAENTAQALGLLEAHADLVAVVADFSMAPGATGAELLRTVAAQRPALLRVMITGTPGKSRDPDVISVSDAVLVKPWKRGVLLDCLVSRLAMRAVT
jgi:CheY-like chemotaxis protein